MALLRSRPAHSLPCGDDLSQTCIWALQRLRLSCTEELTLEHLDLAVIAPHSTLKSQAGPTSILEHMGSAVKTSRATATNRVDASVLRGGAHSALVRKRAVTEP